MAKPRGLGKGLDLMIPNVVGEEKVKKEEKVIVKEEKEQGETLVKISKVEPNREQPRKFFDEDALQELADSIKQFGLLQPILVQDRKDYYEIIAGERRWRAAKLAGLKEVPVIIKNYTEQEIVEIAREHQLMIFSDEIYDRLVMDELEHISIASLAPDLFCVTFSGLSKSPAIFDPVKMKAINFEWIKKLSLDEFKELAL